MAYDSFFTLACDTHYCRQRHCYISQCMLMAIERCKIRQNLLQTLLENCGTHAIGTHVSCDACPAASAAEVKRTGDECGFSGLAARLFKLLGLVAHTTEDRVATAAFKAAGALCDFASGDRAECLAAMATIGGAGRQSDSVIAKALQKAIRRVRVIPLSEVRCTR